MSLEGNLLDVVCRRAAEQGWSESEIIEEALRGYLAVLEGPAREEDSSWRTESFNRLLMRVKEWQERRGVEPLSDEEAMKLAVEEQRAYRDEAGGG